MISKAFNVTAAFIIAMSTSTYTLGQGPKIGSRVDGGIFLYREPVEIYWNDWILHPYASTEGGANQGVISGNGKTSFFVGILSVNCSNLKSYWRSASNYNQFLPSEDAADKIVPASALKNATNFICKKNLNARGIRHAI